MRGKAGIPYFAACSTRITPAYAGKRATMLIPSAFAKDHPRLCGEKVTECSMRYGITGSPPPMRGKASKYVPAAQPSGITPAYAGKSSLSSICYTSKKGSPPPMRGKVGLSICWRLFQWDHPRLCGEKPPFIIEVYHFLGSPPPMRGKAGCKVRYHRRYRITPAYAGKRRFH